MGDAYNSVTGTLAVPRHVVLQVPDLDTVSVLPDGTVIDLVAVERAMTGDPPATLTRAEKRYAALCMVDLGSPIKSAAGVLGIHDSEIHRWLRARQNPTT